MSNQKNVSDMPAIKPEIPPIAETLPRKLAKTMDPIFEECRRVHLANHMNDTDKVPTEVIMRWYVDVAARASLSAVNFAKQYYENANEYPPDDRAFHIQRSIVHQVMQHVEARTQAFTETFVFPEHFEESFQELIEEIRAGRGVWRADEEEDEPKATSDT